MAVTLLIDFGFVLILILANALFALAELAVISAREARLKTLEAEGDTRATTVLELKENPNDFLSTVQVGISMVSILAGAVGGATLGEELASILLRFLPLQPALIETISVILVVLLITYMSLVVGELVPKRLAISNPEGYAMRAGRMMSFLARVSTPLVAILVRSTDFIVGIFGIEETEDVPVTREEIKIMLDQGAEIGVFDPVEEQMVDQIFRLTHMSVSRLMTPRKDVAWLDINDPLDEIKEKIERYSYTRIPVVDEELSDIIGMVNVNHLLPKSLAGEPIDLREFLTEPVYVPENISVYQLLETFRKHRTQIALVVDEYGGLEGLVTGDDILEAIVGEIQESDEKKEPQVVREEEGSWMVDGLYPFDEFQEHFDVESMDDIEDRYYQTVGGFVVAFLGRIPSVGDDLDWSDYHFEVVGMDKLRVSKIRVTPA